MKKISLNALMRKVAFLRLTNLAYSAYTLAEVIIVMLIIAVIVAVSLGITKVKLDNIISYTYYNAYSSLKKISTEMLSDWDPANPEYKQATLENNLLITDKISNFFKNKFSLSNFISPAYAVVTKPNESVDDFLCIDGITPKYCMDTGVYVCPPTNCPIKCPNGSLSYSGTCYVTCPDGSKATSYSNCPSCEAPANIPCGQTWDSNTCKLVGTPKTCPSGYKLNTDSCSCEKLTCENKPDYIPCGQSWDESTCSLTGTAKSCPSGQHISSSCECVVDCPADLSMCKKCDPETGIITQNPDVIRVCSDDTYTWSEDQCKCIPSPRTLPRKGENLCKLFERHANVSNADICTGSIISNNTTNFADKVPDMVLNNGLLIYNMHRNAELIDALDGNTQGGSYEGVPNTNSYGYTVYVDIDGAKGDSQLWSDVYPFYLTLSGKIIPAYDKANPGVSGGDSSRHLQVSVQYEDYSSGNRHIKWLSKSVSFKEGACQSGYVGQDTKYCKNNEAVSMLDDCSTEGNSMCSVKEIKPVKFFF